MQRLNDCTLIIPTFNRPELLRHLLWYLTFRQLNCRILVLDGSCPSTQKVNEETCHALSPNIEWNGYPYDMLYFDRLLDGLKRVETTYVSMCADDDVVYPGQVHECLAFLNTHPDYIACHGCSIGFHFQQDHRCRVQLAFWRRSIDGANFIERFTQLADAYESPYYAVFKTRVLTDCFQGLLPTIAPMYYELFLAFAPLLHGKIQRLNSVYAARNESPSVRADKSETNIWFRENPAEMLAEYMRYKESLTSYLLKRGSGNLDLAVMQRLLDQVFGLFMARTIDPCALREYIKQECGGVGAGLLEGPVGVSGYARKEHRSLCVRLRNDFLMGSGGQRTLFEVDPLVLKVLDLSDVERAVAELFLYQYQSVPHLAFLGRCAKRSLRPRRLLRGLFWK